MPSAFQIAHELKDVEMLDGGVTGETIGLLGSDPALSERRLISDLTALVSTPSVNPGMSERAMAGVVGSRLDAIDCAVTIVEFAPGRPSVAAVIEGPRPGPTLVLNGHMDTVAVDDRARWTSDPFGAELRDGALWGRGALDMKGGLVTQLACASVLARHKDRLSGSLVIHFAAGEECGEPGTLSLLQAGFTGDFGITTEPTDLTVATATRGVAWFRITIGGRSAHASRPDVSLNPTGPAAVLIQRIERYQAALGKRHHPLLGSPTCAVTGLRAGAQHNASPDTAQITVDRRMLPGETVEEVAAEIEAIVDGSGCRDNGHTARVELFQHPFQPAEVPADSPFVAGLRAVRDEVMGDRAPVTGTPYGSDVRNLINDAGMEAVTFGPGDSAFCHCIDERLPIADLKKAALILTVASFHLLAGPAPDMEMTQGMPTQSLGREN